MSGLPGAWARVALSDVCQPVSKMDPALTGRASVRYVDIGTVDGATHRLTQVAEVDSATAPSRCRQVVRAGDTLFSTVRPYLEKIAYIDSSLDNEFASTGFCVLRPIPAMEPRFLFHFASSGGLLDQVLPMQKGVSYPAVLDREVRGCTIPVPPLPEQRRIVDVLDEHLISLDRADASLEAARQWVIGLERSRMLSLLLGPEAIEDLRNLEPSALGAAEPPTLRLAQDWKWQKWGVVGTCQNGRAFPSSLYQAQGVRLLRPGNLGPDGTLEWASSSTKHLSEAIASDFPGFVINSGDIVMNLTAQSLKDDFLGRVCVVMEGDSALLNQRIARLRPICVTSGFALLVFRSQLFRQYVKSLNTGSLIQHMFTKQVDKFWVPVPPPDEQDRIAQDWATMSEGTLRLSQAVDRSARRVVALRRSLLTAAFSGRLTGRSSDMDVIEGLTEEESA